MKHKIVDFSKRAWLITLANICGGLSFIWLFSNIKSVFAVASAGSVMVDISTMPEGEARTITWNNSPVFIRRRTGDEIKDMQSTDLSKMKDPQDDLARRKDPHWTVVVGLCTHLGCIPMSTDKGWLCPCHNSSFDVSGRAIKGPARKNLTVPPYRFVDEGTLCIGEN